MTDGNSGATGPTPAAQPNPTPPDAQTKIVRFNLPDFTRADPETWFVAVEIIFEANKVTLQQERFSYILQHIDSTELSHIRDILVSSATDKYTRTKNRLIQVHGKTRTERLTQLLQGADIPTNCKPSVILASIKHLAGSAEDSPEMKEIIQSIWIQKLPARTREMLAPCSTQPLAVLEEMADRLYVTYESIGASVAAIANSTPAVAPIPPNLPASVPPTQSFDMGMIMSMLSSMQAQISAIAAKQDERSRDRQRSPTPYRGRHRSYSRSKARSDSPRPNNSAPELFNGLCWYHHTFGTYARGCAPGCLRAPSENS